MGSISNFCNENKTQLIIGGVTILCLGGLMKRFYESKNKHSKDDKPTVIDGDVLSYPLYHVKPGVDAIYYSGLPDGFNFASCRAIYDLIFRLMNRLKMEKVDFLDARRRKDLDFEKTGFTLLPYKESFDTNEFHLKENQEKFEKDMEPLILKHFPGAKINQWYSSLFRGDEGQNPAAVDGPHLDSFPDVEKAHAFRASCNDKYMKESNSDENVKTQLEKAKAFKMIGVWKPINMKNPVMDHPLALMDQRTFRPWEDAVEFRQEMSHIDQGEKVWFKNLGGHIRYHEDQKWYYYSNMTTEEVLIFTHLSWKKSITDGKANPHTSFKHPNAPKDRDFDTRKSIESRVMIYWPGDEEENEDKIGGVRGEHEE